MGTSEGATCREEPKSTYNDKHALEVFEHFCVLRDPMDGEQSEVIEREAKDKINKMSANEAAELKNYLCNHREIDLRRKPFNWVHEKIKEIFNDKKAVVGTRKQRRK